MRATLLKVFAGIGAVATLGALVAAAMGFAMIRRGFHARDEPSAMEAFLARQMRALATPRSVRELKNPVQITPEALAEARAHWADHCASCHGNDGRGKTSLGENTFPPAPDMRAETTQSLTDGELYAIIENGIRLTGMPAWGDGTPDNRDSWTLVAFIRHLPRQTAEELEEMKKLNPKSVHETQEQEEEDAFLNSPGPAAETHHHGDHK